MPVHLSRSKDTHTPPRPSNAAASSHSSSSHSSSFSSSAASSILPAPPSNSSHSDIAPSDHSASSLQPSTKNRFFPLHITGPPRTSSLAPMGQTQSRTPAPPVAPSPTLSTPTSVGGRFRRVWGGRRKKSEDITAALSNVQDPSLKGKERVAVESYYATPPESISEQSHLRPESSTSRPSPAPRTTGLHSPIPPSNASDGKKPAQLPQAPTSSGSRPASPPPVPPKLVSSTAAGHGVPAPPAADAPSEVEGSGAMTSDSLPSADIPSNQVPNSKESVENAEDEPVLARQKATEDKEKLKEDWRKSDATVISPVTIRPGALGGSRSPRPVSLAESSHSGHTIVPMNKRLSALITDAEFTMFEESDNVDLEQEVVVPISLSGRPSPTGSMKARKRRSVSLNLGPGFTAKFKPGPSDSSSKPAQNASLYSAGHLTSNAMPGSPLASAHNAPTLTRAAASGYIAPLDTADLGQNTGNNVRTRLAAWTAPTTPITPLNDNRPLPLPPQATHMRRPAAHPPVSLAPPSFRQTAVSMTGSLAPAAGFAKRAVEKVGKAWGGFSSSASTHSGYSSSSSVETRSSSRLKYSEHGMGRHADQSALGPPSSMGGGWKKRRVHHAFSGSSSISSMNSSNASDCDNFVPTGPTLGKRLRGPKRTPSGASIVGGLVFHRDLQSCVRETATDHVLLQLESRAGDLDSDVSIKPLEDRMLPALAVRCAQHILKWGVQEEGLFRVNGRSSHVAKLRSEFDSGADYDMAECDPGDLDPHAVASIFKTYLRELPESILTTALIPYFESALAAEDEASSQGHESTASSNRPDRGPSLPAGPRDPSVLSLRKPPSLSTLAMPSFAGMRAMSDPLMNALTWLISRLPQENRDLLYTVVELIKHTAAHSQQTKMPLGNLLLVFCPSLNMSPSLLRVLCEGDAIWKGVPKDIIVPLAADTQPEKAESEILATPDNCQTDNVGATEEKTSPVAADLPPAPISLLSPPIAKTASESSNIRLSLTPVTPGSLLDDTASYVSASEMRSVGPTRSPSPAASSGHVPPLSSSSDSLNSPSTTSEEPVSPQPVPYRSSPMEKAAYSSRLSLEIPEAIKLVSSSQLASSSPVPFPSSGEGHPHNPLHARRSMSMFSFSKPKSDTVPSSATEKRMKRPSLHLLFHKKSSTPVDPTTISGPQPIAAASVPTFFTYSPNDTPSAPLNAQTSTLSLPPVLDTPISSSPIRMGLGNSSGESTAEDLTRSSGTVEKTGHATFDLTYSSLRTRSYASSVFGTPQQTPIADFYRNRSKSMLLFPSDAEANGTFSLEPRVRAPSEASQVSLSPSIALDIENEASDDWAQSVLIATQTGVQ